MPFQDKIVFITGASRGIGKAIAMQFAKKGAIVIGTATTNEGAHHITESLQSVDARGIGVVLDVGDRKAMDTVLATIRTDFGCPLILVNNAGIAEDNLLLRMKPEQWDRVIDINLSAVYRLTKACLRDMMKVRFGRIINVTSIVAVCGNPGQANYCAAKAGVIGFTKAVAQEMAGVGITVNAVAPGFIQTDMTNHLDAKQQDVILSKIPAKKMGVPDDIAHTVCFLASDEAMYITGQTIHVNGGMCMV